MDRKRAKRATGASGLVRGNFPIAEHRTRPYSKLFCKCFLDGRAIFVPFVVSCLSLFSSLPGKKRRAQGRKKMDRMGGEVEESMPGKSWVKTWPLSSSPPGLERCSRSSLLSSSNVGTTFPYPCSRRATPSPMIFDAVFSHISYRAT